MGDKDIGYGTRLKLYMLEGAGLVHAIIIRVPALLLPAKTLVLAGD